MREQPEHIVDDKRVLCSDNIPHHRAPSRNMSYIRVLKALPPFRDTHNRGARVDFTRRTHSRNFALLVCNDSSSHLVREAFLWTRSHQAKSPGDTRRKEDAS